MPAASRLQGDYHITGNLTLGSIRIPDGDVTNDSIEAGAEIDASKVMHQFPIDVQLVAPAVAITAMTRLLHIVRGGDATLVAAEAIITTQATDVSRTVTVDIQKSTAGGAFASVCTTPIQISSSTSIRDAVAAVFSSTALVAGDILQAVVTVAGGAGNQAEGLLLTLTLIENPS